MISKGQRISGVITVWWHLVSFVQHKEKWPGNAQARVTSWGGPYERSSLQNGDLQNMLTLEGNFTNRIKVLFTGIWKPKKWYREKLLQPNVARESGILPHYSSISATNVPLYLFMYLNSLGHLEQSQFAWKSKKSLFITYFNITFLQVIILFWMKHQG